MRLNYRIQLGLGCMLVFWGISLAESFLTMKQMQDEYHRAVVETLPMVIALEDLRFAAVRIVSSTSEYGMIVGLMNEGAAAAEGEDTSGQEDAEVELINGGIEFYRAAFDVYSHQIDMFALVKDEPRNAIRASGDTLVMASEEIRLALDNGSSARELLELKESLEVAEVSILSTLSEQITVVRQSLELRNAEINRTIYTGLRNLMVSAILGFLGIAIVTVLSSWKIIRPIERLTAAAQRIAKGDFVILPKVTDRHEIGTLTNVFSDMSTNLQRLIVDQRKAVESAQSSEERFRDIAEASSDWIWETGQDHQFTFLSERFSDVTGLNLKDVLGQPVDAFLTPDRIESDKTFAWFETDRPKTIRNLRCLYNDVTGKSRVCRISGKALFDADGGFTGYRGTASDITSEVEAQNKAQHLALHDALTGLPNRLLLAERLDQNFARMKRKGGTVSVICLDLDHFKEVNDTLGHAVGDELLICIAKRLEAAIRTSDTVARLGGDEFVIVQSDTDQPAGAENLCRRLLDAIAEPFEIEGHTIHTGVSLGVSLAPVDGGDHNQLLKNADVAMYRAKNEGRKCYRFFEAGMDAELQERKAMECDLRDAIENDQMEVYYQPLVATIGRDVIGVEALVRWHRPGFGLVSPADFIPLAEETGLILPLGEWILRTSCRQAQSWPGLFVAVNLSPAQFKQRNLVGLVKQVLEETGLAPNRLELEITEGVLLRETDLAVMTLNGFKDLGVRIAMDDFGTGYSSLSYLQRFGFDKIKIDQSFVQALGQSTEAAAIVRTVLALGKSLGMTTTAEGVETLVQLDFLSTERCDQIQGYYFSKPVPADQINDLLGHALRDAEATPLARMKSARSA